MVPASRSSVDVADSGLDIDSLLPNRDPLGIFVGYPVVAAIIEASSARVGVAKQALDVLGRHARQVDDHLPV
jgi:hypothetical protein